MRGLFLTLLLSISCTKYSPVAKDAMGLRVTGIQMSIDQLQDVEWIIGKKKEAKVSQSFVFTLGMPQVNEDDLEFITKTKGIDAWIVRLIVQRGSESQDLGSLYAPFKPRRILRGQSAGAAKNVSLKIYYAAAYPSERFRGFICPAFGHDRKLDDLKVLGENAPFDLTLEQETAYGEKSQLIELTPSSFNAGNTLSGQYFLEIAGYDSTEKTIHGGFKRLPLSILVGEEKRVPVPSCAGENPEFF